MSFGEAVSLSWALGIDILAMLQALIFTLPFHKPIELLVCRLKFVVVIVFWKILQILIVITLREFGLWWLGRIHLKYGRPLSMLFKETRCLTMESEGFLGSLTKSPDMSLATVSRDGWLIKTSPLQAKITLVVTALSLYIYIVARSTWPSCLWM